MIAGKTVLAELEQLAQQQRSSVEDADAQLTELGDRIQAMTQSKEASFKQLAKHYLPQLTTEAVATSFHAIKSDLESVLNRKQKAMGDWTETQAEREHQLKQLSQDRETARNHLQQLNENKAGLELELQGRLEQLAEFRELVTGIGVAEQRLEKLESRIHELSLQADEKLPAYDSSELFRYLKDRQFGEEAYDGSGLTKLLDRWVARLSRFSQAKQSYQFLTSTPKILDDAAELQRSDLQALVQKLNDLESKEADALGLASLRSECLAASQRLDELKNSVESVIQQQEAGEESFATLSSSQDEFYQDALKRFTAFLEGTAHEILQQRAEFTPDSRDDEIVAEIRWLEAEMTKFREQVRKTLRDQQETRERVAGLEYVVRRGQQSEMDSDRCAFEDDFDLAMHTDQFLTGAASKHDLLRTLRRHLKFSDRWADKAVSSVEGVVGHPASQTVLDAVSSVAGAVFRNYVQRAGRR